MAVFAYLIAAHDQPDQLEALLDRLLAPDTPDFAVLHLDAKSPLWVAHRAALADRHPGRIILVTTPVDVRWGHWSVVTAMQLLLKSALTRRFDVAHLLSGSDWPVVPRAQIERDIACDGARDCRIEAATGVQSERMDAITLHDRWLIARDDDDLRLRAARKMLKSLSAKTTAAMRALGLRRSAPYGGGWRKGSQWWSLPREACTTVAAELDLLDRAGRLRFTACADEHVIQTIVADRYGARVTDYRRYIDWSGGRASPAVLRAADLARIDASGAWFARKFDSRIDDFFLSAFPPFA